MWGGGQETQYARAGKAAGQSCGDEEPRPSGAPVGDVCGKLSRFHLKPSDFCRKCHASWKPELHFPEFRAVSALLQSCCHRCFPEISEREMENPQSLFPEVIPKDTLMGYTTIRK